MSAEPTDAQPVAWLIEWSDKERHATVLPPSEWRTTFARDGKITPLYAHPPADAALAEQARQLDDIAHELGTENTFVTPLEVVKYMRSELKCLRELGISQEEQIRVLREALKYARDLLKHGALDSVFSALAAIAQDDEAQR